jgi:hypothetical protein
MKVEYRLSANVDSIAPSVRGHAELFAIKPALAQPGIHLVKKCAVGIELLDVDFRVDEVVGGKVFLKSLEALEFCALNVHVENVRPNGVRIRKCIQRCGDSRHAKESGDLGMFVEMVLEFQHGTGGGEVRDVEGHGLDRVRDNRLNDIRQSLGQAGGELGNGLDPINGGLGDPLAKVGLVFLSRVGSDVKDAGGHYAIPLDDVSKRDEHLVSEVNFYRE